MKGQNPAPHLHSFPPSFFSLPRGANLTKRSQHQPIYTSSSFSCAAPSFSSLACVSTSKHLSPPPCLCIHLFTVFVCAQLLLCMQWWNNVMYSNMKDGPSPGAGNTCFIPAKVLPPSLVCPQLLCSLSLVHT